MATSWACYSVLYREATGKREAGRELHHLIKTKAPKLVITEAGPMQEYQRTRLFRLLEVIQFILETCLKHQVLPDEILAELESSESGF